MVSKTLPHQKTCTALSLSRSNLALIKQLSGQVSHQFWSPFHRRKSKPLLFGSCYLHRFAGSPSCWDSLTYIYHHFLHYFHFFLTRFIKSHILCVQCKDANFIKVSRDYQGHGTVLPSLFN